MQASGGTGRARGSVLAWIVRYAMRSMSIHAAAKKAVRRSGGLHHTTK